MRNGIGTIFRQLSHEAGPAPSLAFAAGSLLLIWEAAGRAFEIHPELLPTPTRILLEIWEQGSRLRAHGLISSWEILAGFLLAALLAPPAACILELLPVVRRVTAPVLSMLWPAPLLIAAPLVFVWFGYGVLPEIILAFLLCFLTITGGTIAGLRSLPPETFELLRTMGATRTQVLLKVRLPASLPSVFSALKSAVPLAIIGTTAGEFAQAEAGLGYVMLAAAFKMETPLVFAGLTVLGMIGLVLYCGVALLENLLTSWHVEMATPREYVAGKPSRS